MFLFVCIIAIIIIWTLYATISGHIKEYNDRKQRYDFLETEYKSNTETIENLTKENKQLKIDCENFKTMYYKLMDAKSIMSIIKILDENNSPDITKEKLSKLWDVLPYYPPDWEIRKWIVKRRDCYTCQKCQKDLYYCKEGFGEVHHIKPLSIGGTNKIENLIYLCKDCHKIVHNEMFKFPFAHDEREALYDDWTYYKIFKQDFKHINQLDPEKRKLLTFDSYIEAEPDTDKYYNISYWENKDI